jgi:oxaloacetate decarboxylase alpha subunit
MRAAGPVARDYPMLASPELERVRKLMSLATAPLVQIRSAELDLTMRR